MCDGSAEFLPSSLSEKTIRAMLTVNGGEILDKDASAILFPPQPKKPVPPSEVPSNLPDADARKLAVANYQKLVKGLYDHQDAMGQLPAGIMANKTVGLSWRVQVLPFIGEEKLFKEFDLKEPWDSAHNKPLVGKMPALFASPGTRAEVGHTFIRTTHGGWHAVIPWNLTAKVGPGRKLPYDRPPGTPLPGARFPASFPDGTSNSILFVEAANAVPWTKPDEILFEGLGPPVIVKSGAAGLPKDAKVPPLGGVLPGGFHAAMADGQITFYKSDYPSIEVAKLLSPSDGWVVDPLGEPDKILYSIPSPPAGSGQTKGPLK